MKSLLLAILALAAPAFAQSTPLVFDQPITTPSVTISGGTTYPAGLYLANLDANGNLSFSPYVKPTGSALTVQPITIPSTSFAAYQTLTIPVKESDIPAYGSPAIVLLNPSTEITKGGIFRYSYSTVAGQLNLTVTSTVGSAQTYGPYTATVSVLK